MSENHYAVLTAVGADRPGLVEDVAAFLFDRGANLEDSRMVNLRGQFAMMVLLAASSEAIRQITADLHNLADRTHLHAELRPASPLGAAGAQVPPGRQDQAAMAQQTAPEAARQAMSYRLTATALDQPGLVHRISQLLRELHVNIENLETHLTAAPYSGAPTFELELAMSVPRQTPIATLRQRLGQLCDDLNIDWHLEAM